jgi:hypothetical protein
MKRRAPWAIALLVLAGPARAADDAKAWVEPMKKVHAKFKGTPGTFAQFGDSITVTMAYWAPLQGAPKNMSPQAAKAHDLVKTYMKPQCWREWKGPDFGSEGRMTIRWAHQNIDTWLKKHNPEVALIMFGTNDLTQVEPKEYEQKTREVVQKCLDNGTVVILMTIPPRHGIVEKSKQYAEIFKKVGQDMKVPVADYFGEIMKRRPDDWDGALPKFKDIKDVYQVPTLVSGDGVHPSNPQKFGDLSDDSLKSNGYLLRGYLTLLAYADVIRDVLKSK